MTLGPRHANVDGFDLHAGIVVPAGQRDRLERLCCYTLRPPIAQTRLRVDAEGVRTKRQLEPWVRRGVAYARSLPPKR